MKQKTYLHCFFFIIYLALLSTKLVDICSVVFSLNGMDVKLGWKIVHAFWYTMPPVLLCFLLVTWLIRVREGKGFFTVEDEKYERKLNIFRRIWHIYVPYDAFFEIFVYEIICSTRFATGIYALTRSRAFFYLVVVFWCFLILDQAGYESLKR